LIRERKEILRRVVGDSIVLTLSLADDLDHILADPAQIEQVLLNLIVNGRDAVDSTGTIRIETCNVRPDENPAEKYDLELSSPHVLLAVTDSGCGMDADTLEHMFEPFFTTKDKGKGTGLGLSTVHGIVKQCGGQIRVESEPGAGSSFRVFFPAITEAVEETEEVARYGSVRGSATILLVEDEADVRKVVSRMLTAGGYTVLEADGPREALRLFEQQGDRIDLLLTDVIMPEMNGSELSARVARLKPGVKTLFMSGFAAGVIGSGGILPEGVSFLQKPFVPDALMAKIARILARDQGRQGRGSDQRK
jgi:CheY-like chemotaxis protein